MEKLRFLTQGETGLVVELGNKIDPKVNTRVHELSQLIQTKYSHLIETVIPTYCSLLVFFDPLQIARNELIQKIKDIVATMPEEQSEATGSKTVVVPTLYGGEAGPDIEIVAKHNNLDIEEVIHIHSSVAYRIYMLGFTPGFPYLGGMSEKIAAPRLKTPRTRIPAGSVGIAGTQTGVYPIESPGGWQLIGRTPLKVFNPSAQQPFLYAAGDFLQFEPISALEYIRIQQEVAQGSFCPRTISKKEAGK